jgi:alpha-galactosidase
LEINQDPLGKPARKVISNPGYQVWSKDLEDGSKAIGIFNLDDAGIKVKIAFPDLGLEGKYSVRDAWRQKDIGILDGSFQTRILRHGVMLVRFTRIEIKPGIGCIKH